MAYHGRHAGMTSTVAVEERRDGLTHLSRGAAVAIRDTILPDLIAVDMLAQILKGRLTGDPDSVMLLSQISDAVMPHVEGIRTSLRSDSGVYE